MPKVRRGKALALGTLHRAKADYSALSESRFTRKRLGLPYAGADADWHFRTDANHLKSIELARDLGRNDPFIIPLVDRAADNLIQNGFTLQPTTGDSALDQDLLADQVEWAINPDLVDAKGELSFSELEWLTARHDIEDGDMIHVPRPDGALMSFEAHRLRKPNSTRRNVVLGVLLDGNRKRQEYWITKKDVGLSGTIARTSDVEAISVRDADGFRQIFHTMHFRRVSQTRGVTALLPLINLATQVDDAQFAKLIQQVVASCFVMVEEEELSGSGGKPSATGAEDTEYLDDGEEFTLEDIAPAMRYIAKPGRKVKGFSPDIPNPEFFPHIKLCVQVMCLNLGLPYIVGWLDAEATNFTGWRGALDQARIGWRCQQQSLMTRFHQPIHRWRVHRRMKRDAALRKVAAKSKINVFSHEWLPPPWRYVQPLQDTQVDLMRWRSGMISPRRLFAERNLNWKTVVSETIEDNALAIEDAIKVAERLSKATGQDIQWRDVLYLPTPEGVKLTWTDKRGSDADGNE